MIFLSLLLAGFLTLVELNCENLFDYFHDEGKQDEEYLPDATRHWNKKRYWRKLNHTAQTLLSGSEDQQRHLKPRKSFGNSPTWWHSAKLRMTRYCEIRQRDLYCGMLVMNIWSLPHQT